MLGAGRHQAVSKLLSILFFLSIFLSSSGFNNPQAAFARAEPISNTAVTPPVVAHHDETGHVSFIGTKGNNPVSVPGAEKAGGNRPRGTDWPDSTGPDSAGSRGHRFPSR